MDALHVHLRRRSVKGEVGRPEPYIERLFEEAVYKLDDRTFEVRKADVLIDHQPFHLMEHGAVRDIGIAADKRAPGR